MSRGTKHPLAWPPCNGSCGGRTCAVASHRVARHLHVRADRLQTNPCRAVQVSGMFTFTQRRPQTNVGRHQGKIHDPRHTQAPGPIQWAFQKSNGGVGGGGGRGRSGSEEGAAASACLQVRQHHALEGAHARLKMNQPDPRHACMIRQSNSFYRRWKQASRGRSGCMCVPRLLLACVARTHDTCGAVAKVPRWRQVDR